ncbi:Fibronectin type III domain-containing protein [Syntrophus gentianae]|uniref:Fibronectin type III domain-containing protein n=2 Tax=Syntrophus gentianae TaxID=43775 RepID=A0A1H7WTE7_9BACT|nr:Fibronectin type III domain-containing protein [Syntrophus gentianae]
MRATSKEGTETAKAITRKIDIKPPIKGSVFTASAGKGQCTLAWSEASDSGSGMNISIPYEVRYQVGADPGSCKGGNPAYIGTALNSVHKGLLSSMKFYYRLCYKDNLGNTSQYSGNPVTCTPKANVSGAYDLPDTRQTACYDQNGTVITCPAQDQSLAQDGSYDIPLSYTDNGNGTVTDNNTGLIWQKRDDGRRYNWYRASGTYHKTYNPSSYNTCGQLLLGGYSNWRLPSKIELMTLVDYGISNSSPKINTTYFPDTKDDYLTVTSFAGDIEKSWIVGFGNGGIAPTSKAKESSVRCVRGEQLDFGNFRDNHDGTVTDKKSGLMWQQDEPGRMTWTQALSYCESLILGKHSDWRLPNFKELQSLANENGAYPAINKIYFPNANCNTSYISAYWSSTTYNSYKNGAYVTDFYDGTFYGGGKWGNPYTRCVRGGPDPFIKAPSNLTAKAVSSEEIDLNWKDNSGNETGFRLQRKKGNCSSTNSWVDLNTTISANSVFFRHSAAAANTQYAYRIRAYNATGYSAYSNCASAKTELE